MPLTQPTLAAALLRCADALDARAADLNERDGQLGDGDLGGTLSKCATNVRIALASPNEDIGSTLLACAKACARASGSSFGTLLVVAFMNAAKPCMGRQALPWQELPILLHTALQSMSARGGAVLGDKTVLDALAAAETAMRGLEDPIEQGQAARTAVMHAIADFRLRPNKIGRARMFAERSIGMDDPGMIAFATMVDACLGVPASSLR